MELKVKHIVFLAVFCFFSLVGHGQDQYPPEPMSQSTGDGPCGQEDDGGISPPIGLCMPINDYIYPLLVLGILLGAYNIHKIEKV